MIKDIIPDFFNKIARVFETKGRTVAASYFYGLRPMGDTSAEGIKKYEDLLARVKKETPDNTSLINYIGDTINQLRVMRDGQEASRQYLKK